MATLDYITDAQLARLGSIDNLRFFMRNATQNDIFDGVGWYQTAHDICAQLARDNDLSLRTVAEAMAVLSPLTRWDLNVQGLISVLEYWRAGGAIPECKAYSKDDMSSLSAQFAGLRGATFNANKLRALWILQGHDVLRGPKVCDFAANIIDPAHSKQVTVDSHYVLAYMGIAASGSWGFGAAWHEVITKDTEVVAAEYGYTASQVQAIVWVVKKRLAHASKLDCMDARRIMQGE